MEMELDQYQQRIDEQIELDKQNQLIIAQKQKDLDSIQKEFNQISEKALIVKIQNKLLDSEISSIKERLHSENEFLEELNLKADSLDLSQEVLQYLREVSLINDSIKQKIANKEFISEDLLKLQKEREKCIQIEVQNDLKTFMTDFINNKFEGVQNSVDCLVDSLNNRNEEELLNKLEILQKTGVTNKEQLSDLLKELKNMSFNNFKKEMQMNSEIESSWDKLSKELQKANQQNLEKIEEVNEKLSTLMNSTQVAQPNIQDEENEEEIQNLRQQIIFSKNKMTEMVEMIDKSNSLLQNNNSLLQSNFLVSGQKQNNFASPSGYKQKLNEDYILSTGQLKSHLTDKQFHQNRVQEFDNLDDTINGTRERIKVDIIALKKETGENLALDSDNKFGNLTLPESRLVNGEHHISNS